VYSHEDRMKVVMLYIKYDLSAADAVRELGYPGPKTLLRWYREYKATGELHRTHRGDTRGHPSIPLSRRRLLWITT
jgi:transposase-like protein